MRRNGLNIELGGVVEGLAVDDLRKSKDAGEFTLAPGEAIHGELTVAGPESSLYLYARHEFQTHAKLHQYITGVLQDLTKVSLIDCLTTLVPGHGSRGSKNYYFASVFPYFVVHGHSCLAPDEKTITNIHFVVDDATTLFYDFDAFGFLLNAKPFIDQIAAANPLGRKIVRYVCNIGGDPREKRAGTRIEGGGIDACYPAPHPTMAG